MYCSQCGAKLPETARFCSQCGAPTAQTLAEDNVEAPDAVDGQMPVSDVMGVDDAAACVERSSVLDDARADEASEEEPASDVMRAEAESSSGEDVDEREAGTCSRDDSVGTWGFAVQPSAGSDAAPEISSRASSDGGAPEGRQTLGQRLLMFRRTTLKAVPTFVLAIIAFVATAATAYAAFKVVTEVIIPAIEQAVEQGQAGDGSADSGDGEVVVAKGDPKNILQIGEILAMEPEDIPDFLESQGLVYMDDVSQWVFGDDTDKMFGALKDAGLYFENPGGAYQSGVEAHDEALEFALEYKRFSDTGEILDGEGFSAAMHLPALSVGTDILWWNHFDYGEQYNLSTLKDGAELTSIRLNDIPLPAASWVEENGIGGWSAGLSDEDVVELCDGIMGLGEPAVVYRPGTVSPSFNSDGSQGDALLQKGEVYASGAAEIDGERYIWYFAYEGSSAYSNAEAGVLPFNIAREVVLRSQLYTEAEWKAADDGHRSGMFVQTLAMERKVGNGYTIRLNFRTGAYEAQDRNRLYTVDNVPPYRELDDGLLEQYGFDSREEMEERQPKPTDGTIVDFTNEGVR